MTEEQFAALVEILERQTLLLEVIAVAVAPEEQPESDECQHPEDMRISLATPAHPEHWICNTCKHEHGGITHN